MAERSGPAHALRSCSPRRRSAGWSPLARVVGWLACAALAYAASPAIASAGELPPTVSRALAEAGIPPSAVAIVVLPVDGGSPLVSHNAAPAMNPASTMKLVTTYAGLELLGAAHTWRTEALTESSPTAGRLTGNLYLRGSGDPKLSLEQFWLLLRQLRTRGVQEINGDVVLDRNAFTVPAHDPGQFDHQPLRPYNAGPDALLVNLKSVRLTLRPDAARKVVEVLLETPSDGTRIGNRLQLTGEACGDWREGVQVAVQGTAIELAGTFAASCGEKALHLAPWTADVQVDALFRALWRELGGRLGGRVRPGRVPPGARVLTTLESPPLAEIIRDINKYSNNVMARQLFLSLDAVRPATAEGARREITRWLHAKGLPMPELTIDNGSGLSRNERISATGLAQLLRAAWQSPVMPELIASLPVAGVDGTLRKRLNEGAASGRAHLKTGYLEGVRAIAGYSLDQSGRRWIVVCMINHAQARAGKAAVDALLLWVAQR